MEFLRRRQQEFVQNEREAWNTYKGKDELTTMENERYSQLHCALKDISYFEVVCINDYAPEVTWRKYEYLRGLVFKSKTVRYTYTSGYKNLDFVWRVPESFDEASLISENIKIREIVYI